MSPDDLALVLDKDETGYHLILNTKESKFRGLRPNASVLIRSDTARFYMAMFPPYDSRDEEELKAEIPDDRMHYRNYPARPAIEVLQELVARFRDLEWIPVNYEGGWPEILANNPDDDVARQNAVCVLFERYGRITD
jgi:hypothetical protein